MNKLNISSLVASVLAIVISLVALGNSQAKFGSYVTGAGITNFDKVDAALGFLVGGTSIVNSSAQWVAGINSSVSATLTGAFVPYSIGSGVLAVSGATSSPSAAQICANNVINYTATNAAASATLPSAVALQAVCLNTLGGSRILQIRNLGTATTSIVVAVGASSTLKWDIAYPAASTTILGGNSAIIRLFSETNNTTSSAMVAIDGAIFQ